MKNELIWLNMYIHDVDSMNLVVFSQDKGLFWFLFSVKS